jgi:hypothetical protein
MPGKEDSLQIFAADLFANAALQAGDLLAHLECERIGLSNAFSVMNGPSALRSADRSSVSLL